MIFCRTKTKFYQSIFIFFLLSDSNIATFNYVSLKKNYYESI